MDIRHGQFNGLRRSISVRLVLWENFMTLCRLRQIKAHSERNAVNAPIQGSAADIIKLAMIELDRAMRDANMKSKMLLQVHDELVFDARIEELEALKSLVIEKMEAAVSLAVPMVAEVGTGANWLEAH